MKNLFFIVFIITIGTFIGVSIAAFKPLLAGQSSYIASIISGNGYKSCVDWDDGQNFFVKESVEGIKQDGSDYTHNDACISHITLKEWYCKGKFPASVNKNCQALGNFLCRDGKCEANQTNQSTCTDSDNGINYYIFGYASGKQANGTEYNYSDYCIPQVNPRAIDDWICAYGAPIPKRGYCKIGETCQDGACVTYAPQTLPTNLLQNIAFDSCSDSDGGKYTTIFGEVTGNTNGQPFSYSDSCKSTTQVKEWYCSGTSAERITMDCDEEHKCIDGACERKWIINPPPPGP